MSDPLRKAAEMALKVLEHSLGYSNDAQNRISEAKQALRQALAQPQEWKHCRHCGFQYRPPKDDKWHPLSQPEQEPVAIVNEGMGGIEWLSKSLPDDTPLYAAPPSIEAAVLAEREACAKIVEADGLARGNEGLVLIKAAGRIRARGEND